MIGDAIGDLNSAKKNQVSFYPIMVGKEKFSWNRFTESILEKFINNSYNSDFEKNIIDEFEKNLSN